VGEFGWPPGGITSNADLLSACALCGAIADFAGDAALIAVELHEHGIVDIRSESALYGLKIGPVAVCG
jgi:hypothetical protein